MAKTVSAGFLELLDRLALTADQASTASTRATAIKDVFDANFTMAERAFTIGSYRRSTIIRPERDIDLLAPLSFATYKDRFDNDPRAFLYFVRDKLNQKTLRDCQTQAFAALANYYRSGGSRAACVMSVGAGKTALGIVSCLAFARRRAMVITPGSVIRGTFDQAFDHEFPRKCSTGFPAERSSPAASPQPCGRSTATRLRYAT